MIRHKVIWGIIVAAGFLSLDALAQPIPPSANSEGAPIDGFVTVVLLASIGYATKKIANDKTLK